MSDVTRILAAIDLSEVSADVLASSMEIASAAAGSVTVVSVLEAGLPQALLPSDDEQSAMVDSLIEPAKTPGVDVRREITKDVAPAKVIVDRARDIGADLIVVGSSGHGAWQRMVLGSTIGRVLDRSTCPVLVVPAAASERGRRDPDR